MFLSTVACITCTQQLRVCWLVGQITCKVLSFAQFLQSLVQNIPPVSSASVMQRVLIPWKDHISSCLFSSPPWTHQHYRECSKFVAYSFSSEPCHGLYIFQTEHTIVLGVASLMNYMYWFSGLLPLAFIPLCVIQYKLFVAKSWVNN